MLYRFLVLMVISVTALAQKTDLATPANQFLSTLDAPLREKAEFKFNDNERFNWHFVPRTRLGVCMCDLSSSQRGFALDLLKASLSSQGYEKTIEVVSLENVLRVIENRGKSDTYRDPLKYYLTIFGTPSPKDTWGWRFEGHHVSLNFSTIGNKIESSTPSFFGSNPGKVADGPDKGKQILKSETDKGFKLVNALSPLQLKSALISPNAYSEIVSFNSRKATPLLPKGLSFKEMNENQQGMLLDLLQVYVTNYELGFSDKLMSRIKKAGVENLTFAWAGSVTDGSGYYYRIQGPMLLIELDNTQNDANHVHSVVRDLTNDFGEDILREHYESEHQGRK
ncbi:MAG: DUF3500 domain-containing protein [Chryseolinea sp.]